MFNNLSKTLSRHHRLYSVNRRQRIHCDFATVSLSHLRSFLSFPCAIAPNHVDPAQFVFRSRNMSLYFFSCLARRSDYSQFLLCPPLRLPCFLSTTILSSFTLLRQCCILAKLPCFFPAVLPSHLLFTILTTTSPLDVYSSWLKLCYSRDSPKSI